MSEENKGVRGPASLRFRGQKISELNMAEQAGISAQMPAFLEEQRRMKVDRITARYPRGTEAQYNAAIRVCEQNMKTFANAKNQCMENMGKYMDLLKKRDGDLEWEEADAMVEEKVQAFIAEHRDNSALVDETGKPIPGTLPFRSLMAALDVINARRRAYEDEALWRQIGQFQEERDRYDAATEQETVSIFQMREAISLVRERDRLIHTAMTEPLSVE